MLAKLIIKVIEQVNLEKTTRKSSLHTYMILSERSAIYLLYVDFLMLKKIVYTTNFSPKNI